MVENIFRHLAQKPEERFARSPRPCSASARRSDLRGKFAVIANSATRGEPRDLLLRRDHHRRLRAAIHAVRGRRAYLRPDGQDLCLCHRRRPDRDVHHLPGPERPAAARRRQRGRDLRRARRCAALRPGAGVRARPTASSTLGGAGLLVAAGIRGRAARSGWNFCRSSRRAISGSARRCRRRFRSRKPTGYVNRMRQIIGSFPEVGPSSPSTDGPTTAPMRPASSTPSSIVPLKPFDAWPRGIDKEKLTEADERSADRRRFPASSSISRRISRTTSRRPHRA